MKTRLKKITITFTLIALLPVAFILYELGSLNTNEKILQEIYQNQLEAILYSVNQYSDDVINNWANKINIELLRDNDSDSGIVSLMANGQLSAVQHIYFSDLQGNSELYSVHENSKDELKQTLDSLIVRHEPQIQKLQSYYEGGFKKMQALGSTVNGQKIPIMFILEEGSNQYRLAVMVISLPVFIQQVLGPKMQAISKEKFIISAFNNNDQSLIYSTESVYPGETEINRTSYQGQDSQKKELWLLPGYYLGITLKEATIDELVKDRVTTSMVILLLLIVILAFGIVFLYRNIKSEMDLSQAKSEFVSNVSHEIRTPLSLISMYAETLEMNRVSEDRKQEYYSIIAKETIRLSKIVNRILNFSQMEANKKVYERKLVSINNICDEILKSYLLHLNDKGFTFECYKAEELPLINGDRDSIIEAIINLLDNAIKYSRDKKHIRVSTGVQKSYAFIEVKDNGMGIKKTFHQAIFEQFFRAPSGDVHNTKGSGLGLTLVKKTMEAHQGKVSVESIPDQGSTFRLYFPIVKNEVA